MSSNSQPGADPTKPWTIEVMLRNEERVLLYGVMGFTIDAESRLLEYETYPDPEAPQVLEVFNLDQVRRIRIVLGMRPACPGRILRAPGADSGGYDLGAACGGKQGHPGPCFQGPARTPEVDGRV